MNAAAPPQPDWTEDAPRAVRLSHTEPLPPGVAPNHTRCCFFNLAGRRCILATPHASVEHNAGKPPAQESP